MQQISNIARIDLRIQRRLATKDIRGVIPSHSQDSIVQKPCAIIEIHTCSDVFVPVQVAPGISARSVDFRGCALERVV
jgi:hypothetical protein